MDYTPNLAARSLITRRTGTIGLIVSDITNPFYPELLGVLHNEFALAGYRTVLFNERTDAPLERHVADLVNGAAVDGLVYVSATLGMPLARKRHAAGSPSSSSTATSKATRSTRSSPTTAAEGARSPRRCSTWGTAASRSSPDRRTRRRAATESRASARASSRRGVDPRRHAPPCRAVQPPQRLPVGARPSRIAGAAVRDLRGQRPHRLRRARRGSPHRDPRPRRPLRRRLRRHRDGGLGGVQPDHGQAAPREDGTGGRRPAARADRRCRARPHRPVAARSPSSSSGAGRSRPPQRAETRRGGLV